MAACNPKTTLVVLFLSSIFLVSFDQAEMRPFGDEKLTRKQQGLVLQSLPQGGPTHPSPNPCTYVPGRGKGSCTLNGMNVAGSVVRSPPAFPGLVEDVGIPLPLTGANITTSIKVRQLPSEVPIANACN